MPCSPKYTCAAKFARESYLGRDLMCFRSLYRHRVGEKGLPFSEWVCHSETRGFRFKRLATASLRDNAPCSLAHSLALTLSLSLSLSHTHTFRLERQGEEGEDNAPFTPVVTQFKLTLEKQRCGALEVNVRRHAQFHHTQFIVLTDK